jgi:arylformamidase
MRRIVDLTMYIEEGMQTFPTHWHPFVEITQLGRHGIEDRVTHKVVLGTHTGTHIDAPLHFIPGGATVDTIPLEQLNGPARLLDLSDTPAFGGIEVEQLKRVAGDKSVERVLIRFDGDKRLGTLGYYSDQPWLSEESAQWLVDNGCRLVGLDVSMPDNPKNGRGCAKDSPNHKILLGNGTIILEYMTNLAAIGAEEFELVVAPLKLRGLDGAPVRAFAVVEE